MSVFFSVTSWSTRTNALRWSEEHDAERHTSYPAELRSPNPQIVVGQYVA